MVDVEYDQRSKKEGLEKEETVARGKQINRKQQEEKGRLDSRYEQNKNNAEEKENEATHREEDPQTRKCVLGRNVLKRMTGRHGKKQVVEDKEHKWYKGARVKKGVKPGC